MTHNNNLFRAIWEFALSRDCVAHSQNPGIVKHVCAISKLPDSE